MTCAACQRMNLAGGVRCVYCGVALPPALDFDVEMAGPPAAAAPDAASGEAAKPPSQAGRAGLGSTLVLLALKGKSLLALLKFGKIATTLGTMFLSVWAYSRFFGWSFAAGIVACIFVHEMGHVVVNWSKGLKQTAPMFIPFVGVNHIAVIKVRTLSGRIVDLQDVSDHVILQQNL